MASIFSKIIVGEIPSYKIAENDQFIAFLDISPVKKGHTLVVPKTEIDYVFDLPDELLGELMLFSKRVAAAIEKVIPCERIGITVLGLEVPHAHVHLIPLDEKGMIDFRNKEKVDQAELPQIAQKIAAEFK